LFTVESRDRRENKHGYTCRKGQDGKVVSRREVGVGGALAEDAQAEKMESGGAEGAKVQRPPNLNLNLTGKQLQTMAHSIFPPSKGEEEEEEEEGRRKEIRKEKKKKARSPRLDILNGEGAGRRGARCGQRIRAPRR